MVMTTPGSCGPGASCGVIGTAVIDQWAPKAYSVEHSTGTVVVVQIINTESNTTRISTIAEKLPPGFEPPPTNSMGTRTAAVSYAHDGTTLTTSV